MTADETPGYSTRKAADQDGYDGGYIATDGTHEAWGKDELTAGAALMRVIFEESVKKMSPFSKRGGQN